MKRAPTAVAIARAARASDFSTLTPSGTRGTARPRWSATTAIAATVAASTRPGANGTSPKFSSKSASNPLSARARASASAPSMTADIEAAQRGLPGSGERCTMPISARSSFTP